MKKKTKKMKKIELAKLQSEQDLFGKGFCYPREYRLKFPIFVTCRYCKKKSFTDKVNLFDGNIICNCKHCGGRHFTTIDRLQSMNKKEKILLGLIIVLILILLILIFV